ncbi:MAG: hypothetical protein ACKV2V_16905 [Blastocatellia bacterium]
MKTRSRHSHICALLLCLATMTGMAVGDVVIYYRPVNQRLSIEDWGHVFIYARNDETGAAAYFDYYPEYECSVLGEVGQGRIDQHASLTIGASAAQEQAILDGMLDKQKSLPEWKLRVLAALFGHGSTCVSVSKELLKRGGINLDGRDPAGMWESAYRQYSDEYLKWKERMPPAARKQYPFRPGEGGAKPRVGVEYGRDPRGRMVDNKAINNVPLYFRDGKRVHGPGACK